MSTPGWYPDPGGDPGRFRYWDGAAWSDRTSNDPGQRPPNPNRRSKRSGWLIAGALTVILVLVVTAVVLIRDLGGDGRLTGPQPSSTISAWDDSKPIPSPSPSPSPPPSPSGTPSQQQEIACPDADPYATATHPADGRIYGGKLSFPQVDGYDPPAPKGGLSWFYDVSSQSQTTEPGWESWFAVGEVAVGPGFESPQQAAESSMQCAVNDTWFSRFDDRTDVHDEKITVDGRTGWRLSAEIRVDNPDLSVEGDLVTIVFIDDGRDDRLSGFVGIVPIDDGPRNELADQVRSGLRVG